MQAIKWNNKNKLILAYSGKIDEHVKFFGLTSSSILDLIAVKDFKLNKKITLDFKTF